MMNESDGKALVTIVVPVYNVEEYLDRCITSLRNQTYENIEMILVDDGSTDSSGVISERLANEDCRIRVIHKQNQGLGEARNTGIDEARGEWICFVDSDDFVHERYIELLLKAATEYGALYAQCRYVKGTDNVLPVLAESIEFRIFELEDFFRYCFVTPGHSVYTCWNNIYHRSLFEKIRFLPIRHTEDVPFVQECLDFCANQKLVAVNQPMYYWFQRAGSIMNQGANLNLLHQIEAYEIVLDFWMKRGKEFIYDMFFDTYFGCLIDAYTTLRRDLPEAREQYEFLVDKIKCHLYQARRKSHSRMLLTVGGFDIFRSLSDKIVVLYGYGENGKKILPWFSHFGIKIHEIWDSKAEDNGQIGEISFRKMHAGLSADSVILLTVLDLNARMSIKQNLHGLGYYDIFDWNAIERGCRYRIYREYLPFLWECDE